MTALCFLSKYFSQASGAGSMEMPLALNNGQPCTMLKGRQLLRGGEGSDVTDASSTSLSSMDFREDHRSVTKTHW